MTILTHTSYKYSCISCHLSIRHYVEDKRKPSLPHLKAVHCWWQSSYLVVLSRYYNLKIYNLEEESSFYNQPRPFTFSVGFKFSYACPHLLCPVVSVSRLVSVGCPVFLYMIRERTKSFLSVHVRVRKVAWTGKGS